MTCSLKITSGESLAFQKAFISEEEMNQCRDEIVTKDKEFNRIGFYFPKLQEAKKVQNMVLKPFALIIAFFRDMLTFSFNYKKLKSNLREDLAVYKYLKSQGINTIVLNTDSFEITFYKLEEDPLSDCSVLSTVVDKSIIDVNDGLKFIGPRKIIRNEISENRVNAQSLAGNERDAYFFMTMGKNFPMSEFKL